MTFPHVDMYIPNPGMVRCTEPCKLSPEGAGVLGQRVEEGVVDDIADYLLQISRRCSGLILVLTGDNAASSRTISKGGGVIDLEILIA